MMKTKIVYALTSDNTDFCLEQTYVSICTLRKYHPTDYVGLVVDEITDNTIIGKRSYILDVITEKIVITAPSDYSKVARSRFLKTTMRNHIAGDFLFIDSDTVIIDDLSELDNLPGDIYATLDTHVTLDKHSYYESTISQQAKAIDWQITELDKKYFNSGLMLVKDTELSRTFYKRWNEEWAKGLSNLVAPLPSDQPSLGKVNAELDYVINELPGIWNCQFSVNGLRFFNDAKILHYFSSTIQKGESDNVYLLMNKEVFASLKASGIIDETLKEMMNHPKSLFTERLLLLSGNDLSIYQSAFVKYVYVLYNKHRKIYNLINNLLEVYSRRNRK